MGIVDIRLTPKWERFRVFHLFEEFLNMGVEIAHVDIREDDYKYTKSAYVSLRARVKRWKAPIKVVQIKGEIYLIRKEF